MRSTILAALLAGFLGMPFARAQDEAGTPGKENADATIENKRDGVGQDPERRRRPDPNQRRRMERRPGRNQEGPIPADRLAELIKRLDANGDGVISQDEAPERLAERFAQLDANGDGGIDQAEFQAVRQKLMRGPGAGGPPESRRPGSPGEGRPRLDPQQMFQRLDQDGSGTLSKAEVPERLAERFDQIDLNGDGELDEIELAEMRKQIGRDRPEMSDREGGDGAADDDSAPVEPKRPGRGG
jgi:collagen type III alpha